jgi:hypothetical protein
VRLAIAICLLALLPAQCAAVHQTVHGTTYSEDGFFLVWLMICGFVWLVYWVIAGFRR